jgi:hypothetical protein
MTTKQILLLAACLGSIGSMVAGFHAWGEAITPLFVGGAIANVAAHIAAALSETKPA